MKYNEISHFSHHHNLHFESHDWPYKCDGCHEVGIGSRYKCAANCDDDFDLHVHCALHTPTLYHPFYPKCSFQFLAQPPGHKPRYCNACEKDVTGFLYHCSSCGFDLHPCCARLPAVLNDGDGARLFLHPKSAAPCLRCGQRGRSWCYQSACKKYNLHVACVREMLVESWHEVYAGKCDCSGGDKEEAGTRIPGLKGTLQSYHYAHHKSKGKVQKCCVIAGMALQFVISAVLGDPTALVAGVVGSLLSRS